MPAPPTPRLLGGVLLADARVAIDQRVRELAMGVHELAPIPLERARIRILRPEVLALGDEERDPVEQRLDAVGCCPQT